MSAPRPLVLAAGLRFPAPTRRHNLPAQPTELIGRQGDVAAVRDQLRRPDVRHVTLVGPPGIGKTRLAVEIAATLLEDAPDGVFFVDLSSVADPDLVLPSIAHTLGLRESAHVAPLRKLADHLRENAVLLVLDNFEQVVGASSQVAELLSATRRVKILATSREALRTRWEHVFIVSALDVPDVRHLPTPEQLGANPAVALFVQRAQAVKPDFLLDLGKASAVAEICARLEGLPLAIELAAARTRVLDPDRLIARLRQRLDLLSDGARDLPSRQRTLRGAIGWSDSLLQPAERSLFHRLAVFVGGWDLEAVEAVCLADRAGELVAGEDDTPPGASPCAGDSLLLPSAGGGERESPSFPDPSDLLASLVDKSLVRREGSGGAGARFGMPEIIREYALEQVAWRGERERLRRRHARYFLALAERAEPELEGPAQIGWLDQLERDHDNLRAALRFSLESGDADPALRLSGALWKFWWIHGHVVEGQRWLDDALARSEGLISPARGKALSGAGNFARYRGEVERAVSLHEESLAIHRALNDPSGIARSLQNLGMAWRGLGGYERARELLEEGLALYRGLGNQNGVALALNNLGLVARDLGESERAATLHEESLELRRRLGDRLTIAHSTNDLAIVLGDRGDFDRAAELHRASLMIYRELLDTLEIGVCIERLAWMASAREQAERSARLFGAAETIRQSVGVALPRPYEPDHRRWMAAARLHLGEGAFEAAWAEGRALGLEAAIDLARADGAAGGTDEPGGLTPREREVAVLVARGLTNRQIAAHLVISERTAEAHVANIRTKLEFSRRAQIAAWAVDSGLVPPGAEPPTSP